MWRLNRGKRRLDLTKRLAKRYHGNHEVHEEILCLYLDTLSLGRGQGEGGSGESKMVFTLIRPSATFSLIGRRNLGVRVDRERLCSIEV